MGDAGCVRIGTRGTGAVDGMSVAVPSPGIAVPVGSSLPQIRPNPSLSAGGSPGARGAPWSCQPPPSRPEEFE